MNEQLTDVSGYIFNILNNLLSSIKANNISSTKMVLDKAKIKPDTTWDSITKFTKINIFI